MAASPGDSNASKDPGARAATGKPGRLVRRRTPDARSRAMDDRSFGSRACTPSLGTGAQKGRPARGPGKTTRLRTAPTGRPRVATGACDNRADDDSARRATVAGAAQAAFDRPTSPGEGQAPDPGAGPADRSSAGRADATTRPPLPAAVRRCPCRARCWRRHGSDGRPRPRRRCARRDLHRIHRRPHGDPGPFDRHRRRLRSAGP